MTQTVAVAGIYNWQEKQRLAEVVEIDSQLLTDDLPIDAYLDRGFQNWLKSCGSSCQSLRRRATFDLSSTVTLSFHRKQKPKADDDGWSRASKTCSNERRSKTSAFMIYVTLLRLGT